MKKYIAPIIIVGFLLTWLLYQAISLLNIFQIYGDMLTTTQKITIMAIIFGLILGLLYVLGQRIIEIRNESKEDLRNY